MAHATKETRGQCLMEFCPKCGAKLVPKKIRAEGEKPKYAKVWEYGKGWQTIEKGAEAAFMMACPKCGYQRWEEEPKPAVKAKPAPLPDMPLGSKRYYPSYMSPNEYFRDEMRQADVVESITRKAPAEPCKDCHSSIQWLNHHCPKCGANYCFTCACRAGWKCPKCGNELI